MVRRFDPGSCPPGRNRRCSFMFIVYIVTRYCKDFGNTDGKAAHEQCYVKKITSSHGTGFEDRKS